MPYKDTQKGYDKHNEGIAKANARRRALQTIKTDDPSQTAKNLDAYLFQMGAQIRKGDSRQMWLNYLKYKEVMSTLEEPTMPLTVFMVMGLTVDDVKAILAKKLFADNKDVFDVVSRVVMFVLADIEQAHLNGKLQTTTLIWYQKNFAGMSDFPDKAAPVVTQEEVMTPTEIADKYKGILD